MCCQNSKQIQELGKFGGAFLEALKRGQIQFDPTEKVFMKLADIRAQLREHYQEIFEKHCRELMAFKEEFGTCNVPKKYAKYPQLHNWCEGLWR